MRWIGTVNDINGVPVKVLVEIPHSFPHSPPSVKVLNGTHSLTDREGYISTRKIRRWRPDFHVFQVINEAVPLIQAGVYTPEVQPNMAVEQQSQKQALMEQKSLLVDLLEQKRQTLNSMNMESLNAQQDYVENTLMDIEHEMDRLENQFDNLEINETEFAKRYVKLAKKYYILKMTA